MSLSYGSAVIYDWGGGGLEDFGTASENFSWPLPCFNMFEKSPNPQQSLKNNVYPAPSPPQKKISLLSGIVMFSY